MAIKGLVQQIKSFERMAAKAAVTGDYQTALLAMTINPLVPSDIEAREILDELFEAHKEHLPQFYRDGKPVWRHSEEGGSNGHQAHGCLRL